MFLAFIFTCLKIRFFLRLFFKFTFLICRSTSQFSTGNWHFYLNLPAKKQKQILSKTKNWNKSSILPRGVSPSPESTSDDKHCNSRPNYIRTGNFFPNLVKSNRNQIVFTTFRLIWNQTDVRLVPNQSKKGKYNLISV